MKKYLLPIILCSITLLSGCSLTEKPQSGNSSSTEYAETAEDAKESYLHYDMMDEINIEGEKVTIVLEENQAIPYRWSLSASDNRIAVLSDFTSDGFTPSSQVGVSDTYRVFELDCGSITEAEIKLRLLRITGDKEASEERSYLIYKKDGKLQYKKK